MVERRLDRDGKVLARDRFSGFEDFVKVVVGNPCGNFRLAIWDPKFHFRTLDASLLVELAFKSLSVHEQSDHDSGSVDPALFGV